LAGTFTWRLEPSLAFSACTKLIAAAYKHTHIYGKMPEPEFHPHFKTVPLLGTYSFLKKLPVERNRKYKK